MRVAVQLDFYLKNFNAGRGATRFLFEEFQALAIKKVGVAAGHGNNGGDGFVIARYLAQKGIKVTVYLFASRSMVKGDAAANLNLLDPLNVDILEIPDPKAFEHYKASMTRQDIWVDAILGTGLKSDVKAYFKQIIDVINSLNKSGHRPQRLLHLPKQDIFFFPARIIPESLK